MGYKIQSAQQNSALLGNVRVARANKKAHACSEKLQARAAGCNDSDRSIGVHRSPGAKRSMSHVVTELDLQGSGYPRGFSAFDGRLPAAGE
jgi:hypothetical protein